MGLSTWTSVTYCETYSLSSRLLALAWFHAACCGRLMYEPVDGIHFWTPGISVSLSFLSVMCAAWYLRG